MTDVKIIVEHVDREMSYAMHLKDSLNAKNISTGIYSYYFDLWKIPLTSTKVLIMPFCRDQTDVPLCFFEDTPTTFNLNYEQYLSRVNWDYKKPNMAFSLNQLHHISWSHEFDRSLLDCGVTPNNIHRGISNFILQLMDELKCCDDQNSINKDIVFLPLNFAWAFSDLATICAKIKRGYPEEEAYAYKAFAQKHLKIFLRNLFSYANQQEDVNFVLRPHPTVSVADYKLFCDKHNLKIPANVLLTRSRTAAYWVLKAKCVISNESTIIYECQKLGLQSYRVNFLPYPNFLKASWHSHVQNLSNFSSCEFSKAPNRYMLGDCIQDILSEHMKDISDLVALKMSENTKVRASMNKLTLKYSILSIIRNLYCKINSKSALAYDKI